MSSHTLDVAGQRPLTTTTNDPAATKVWLPAKPGEDVAVSVSAKETRIGLLGSHRIERVMQTASRQVMEDGKAKKDEAGAYVYEEYEYESLYLVGSGFTLFGRTSKRDPEQEGVEQHPSTSVYVRKFGDELHPSEKGTLIEDHTIEELLNSVQVGDGTA